jgi:PAS domain S-box-containing protein
MARAAFVAELLEHSADGAYVIDGNQRIAAWNKAAESLLGFGAADVVGQPCFQILGGYGDDGCVVCRRGCRPFTAGQHGEPVDNFDVQVRTAHGAPRWVNVTIIPLALDDAPRNGSTPPMAVVHLVRDIEAKKQAEHFAADVAAMARHLSAATAVAQSEECDPLITPLTEREMQVLRLLSQGADTAGIAAQLLIGTATVRNHVQRILNKLGVHSRLEAVTYARDHHLLDD